MSSTRTRTRSVAAALATVAALGAGGTALAATGAGPAPTTVTVAPAVTLTAGATSPFDAPGVKAIRRGKPIPAGYVLPGFTIKVDRGAKMAGAALRFACPDGKRLRTFASTGHAGFSSDGQYVGHKAAWVTSTPSAANAGTTGTLYAVCR
jgi:hypothetical protein